MNDVRDRNRYTTLFAGSLNPLNFRAASSVVLAWFEIDNVDRDQRQT